MSALIRLSSLLDAEREAALAADVEALEALQAEKEQALAELAEAPPPSAAQSEIVKKARANLGLLRQLAELHQALLLGEGAMPATYGPTGVARIEDVVSLRRF